LHQPIPELPHGPGTVSRNARHLCERGYRLHKELTSQQALPTSAMPATVDKMAAFGVSGIMKRRRYGAITELSFHFAREEEE